MLPKNSKYKNHVLFRMTYAPSTVAVSADLREPSPILRGIIKVHIPVCVVFINFLTGVGKLRGYYKHSERFFFRVLLCLHPIGCDNAQGRE